MLIELNSQYGFWFWWKVSNLNPCKSTTCCCWKSAKHCSLPLRYRVFILLFSSFPFLNLGFGHFYRPIFKFELALNFRHDCVLSFWEQKHCLKGYLLNINIVLYHLVRTNRVNHVPSELNLFQGNRIVGARHHQVFSFILHSFTNLKVFRVELRVKFCLFLKYLPLSVLVFLFF